MARVDFEKKKWWVHWWWGGCLWGGKKKNHFRPPGPSIFTVKIQPKTTQGPGAHAKHLSIPLLAATCVSFFLSFILSFFIKFSDFCPKIFSCFFFSSFCPEETSPVTQFLQIQRFRSTKKPSRRYLTTLFTWVERKFCPVKKEKKSFKTIKSQGLIGPLK